jgi:hypothetical protein
MKHLVEYPLEDGGSIVIEVDEPESEGTDQVGASAYSYAPMSHLSSSRSGRFTPR